MAERSDEAETLNNITVSGLRPAAQRLPTDFREFSREAEKPCLSIKEPPPLGEAIAQRSVGGVTRETAAALES